MGRVIQFEIHCSDLDRAERFYTGIFGWTSVDDLAAVERQVLEAGGVRALDRVTIPGVGDLSRFEDTEGTVFGALQAVAE